MILLFLFSIFFIQVSKLYSCISLINIYCISFGAISFEILLRSSQFSSLDRFLSVFDHWKLYFFAWSSLNGFCSHQVGPRSLILLSWALIGFLQISPRVILRLGPILVDNSIKFKFNFSHVHIVLKTAERSSLWISSKVL